jgi:stearoyl-CoA desaturase (delta-9 desaturase)
MVGYMSVVHVMALWGAWIFLSDFRWGTLAMVVLTYWLSGLGITCGAHRLWSHRSFRVRFFFFSAAFGFTEQQARDPLRFFLALCNSMGNQGSIFHWSRDHRVHHRHSESAADPHNANRGMFFAHMGWLFVDKNREVVEAGQQVGMKDLQEDWIVMWQENNKQWLMPLMCFVVPSCLAMLVGDSYWRGLFVCGAMRYVLVLHATWCVNSLAHWYGDRPYADINPAENWIVTALTGGEGWHNWHHSYPSDYSTSELGWLFQFNATTFFIDSMAFIGQAYDRKKRKSSVKENDDNDHVNSKKESIKSH